MAQNKNLMAPALDVAVVAPRTSSLSNINPIFYFDLCIIMLNFTVLDSLCPPTDCANYDSGNIQLSIRYGLGQPKLAWFKICTRIANVLMLKKYDDC